MKRGVCLLLILSWMLSAFCACSSAKASENSRQAAEVYDVDLTAMSQFMRYSEVNYILGNLSNIHDAPRVDYYRLIIITKSHHFKPMSVRALGPCGNGKKYKKCCGRNPALIEAEQAKNP